MENLAEQHIIEILLPLYDNEGQRFPPELFRQLREEVVDAFGGLTAFVRNPAVGLWEQDGHTSKDDIVIFEVMTEDLDRDWWNDYCRRLEVRFRQDVVIVRARRATLL